MTKYVHVVCTMCFVPHVSRVKLKVNDFQYVHSGKTKSDTEALRGSSDMYSSDDSKRQTDKATNRIRKHNITATA